MTFHASIWRKEHQAEGVAGTKALGPSVFRESLAQSE